MGWYFRQHPPAGSDGRGGRLDAECQGLHGDRRSDGQGGRGRRSSPLPRVAAGGEERVRFAGVSDIGRVRETNEDSYCMEALPPSGRRWLLAVADGLGGCSAGEVASRIAIQALREGLRRRRSPGTQWDQRLRSAIEAAHAAVLQAAADPDLVGMGTTLTAVVVQDRRVFWGHVGDSRAYVLHDGGLRLLTRDHSLVGQLAADGWIGEEDARRHPARNVLTQALGMHGGGLSVETGVSDLVPGDWLILTTDGLTTMVPTREIEDSVRAAGPPLSLCEDLVSIANARGGPDNITVIAAQA